MLERPTFPDEARYMRRALVLAERGRGQTHPNPVVGAVLVRDGRVVGEGYHRALGEPHAEAEALRRAGARARGATLYVTLEPCAHHGRTPPCTDALIAAGVRRVVVGVRDPHCIVNGRGLRILRRAGIRVEVGLLGREARAQLGGYWKAMTAGLPRVTWKVAATLDGKVADAARRSRWITGPEARRLGHRWRAASDAVVVGAGTVRADDPRLTVRPAEHGRRQPLRVVCATRLSLPAARRLLRPPLARGTVVACGARAPRRRERALRTRGVEVWRLPVGGGGVRPRALLERLARAGCHEVLLEAGPALGTAWLRRGLVDRLLLLVAPSVLGAEGLAWCGPLGRRRLGRVVRAEKLLPIRAGRDVALLAEGLR
jgi:diaminohydroxyphosphoribosylaminopyrimidine deaminase/5-amino-6-(5-phosphoribosylamino)uracil reductase